MVDLSCVCKPGTEPSRACSQCRLGLPAPRSSSLARLDSDARWVSRSSSLREGTFRVVCCARHSSRLFVSRHLRSQSAVLRNLAGMTRGTKVKWFVIGEIAATACCGASALAADPPTKAPATLAPATLAPATSCFASFYDYVSSSAQDCPLTWNGITVYGAIDIGVDYMTHGVPFNGAYPQGIRAILLEEQPRATLQHGAERA